MAELTNDVDETSRPFVPVNGADHPPDQPTWLSLSRLLPRVAMHHVVGLAKVAGSCISYATCVFEGRPHPSDSFKV